jgi:hypothetical protein
MADVSGKFFSAKKVRTGVSPSSPGVEQGETLPPVNPPGSDLNSVGLTMPSAFEVANSPLTSNGTIAVTGAGTVSQYVRGDGSLADFPESIGSGASVSYYLNGSVNQGTIGGVTYYEMNKTPIIGAGTDFTRNSNGYIASFLTDANDPALLVIPAGNWNFETYFEASSGGGSPTFYLELYKYDGTTFTLIASNSGSPKLINDGTSIEAYFSALAVPQTTLTLTDRLAIRIYVTTAGRTITLHTENGHLCQVITTFTTGLSALNGLTSQVQFFAVGTSGTNFNIASATDTHTFNLPTASATNRGALASADWSTFNNKQNQLNGTGFVKASGTTITYDNSTYQVTSEKGQPNGYASLDGNGKVPLTQINDALIGNVNYQGLWNASTNNPTLVNPPSSGTKGYYYIVSTAGTFASISFEVGDWIISNGSAWQKVDNTDAVSSVFGRTGNVTATNGDYNTSQVTENTNLYFTQARVSANTDVAANTAARHNAVTLGTANGLSLSTQQLSLQLATSGQNGALSSTDWNTFNNKENAITAGTTAQYFRGDKTFQTLNTAAVPESGNLYFTNARAIASVLTGYTSGAGTISAADSILSAIQKLNGNIGALVTGVSSVNGQTGAVTLTTSNIAEGTNLYFTQARVSANTDVAANTAARHAAVTLGTANGLSLNTQQLSLGLASAGVTGALSGTDWTTFNNKQAALNGTGFVKISGTTISYDNSTYLTTAAAASTYLALAGGTMTGNINWTANDVGLTWSRNTDGAAIKFISVGDGTGESYLQIGTSDNGNEAIVFTQTSLIRVQIDTDGLLKNGSSQRYVFENGGTWGIAVTNGVVTTGSYANPSWITSLDWSKIISRPTTLAGYGITDAVPSNRTITINGTTLDLSANRTYNVGTVTSVAALTLGTSGTDLSSSVANGTTTPVITLNVPTASATNRGALSAADWTTFNNKQNALTNPVTGTGDNNFLPKFTASTTIGNSQIFDNGTRVGIYTSSITNTTLTIYDGTGNGDILKVDTNGTKADIWLNNSTTTNGAVRIRGESNGLKLITGSQERVFIDSSGNLGLGVTPGAWQTSVSTKAIEIGSLGNAIYGVGASDLRIMSNTYFDGSYKYAFSGALSALYTVTDGSFTWRTAPSGTAGNAISFTQAMTLGSNSGLSIGTPSAAPSQGLLVQGNVGIGVSPDVKLDVLGTSDTSDVVRIRKSSTGSRRGALGTQSGVGCLDLYNDSTELNIRLLAQGNSYFNGGNVGIGTASPSARLHIGESGSAAQLWLQRTDGYNPVKLIGGTLSDGNGFKITMNTTDAFAITSGGNVGIGTNNPNYLLHIAAGAANPQLQFTSTGTGSTTSDGFHIGVNNSTLNAFLLQKENADLQFLTNDTERMRITSGGNVGIGTTPSAFTGYTNLELANSSGSVLTLRNNANTAKFAIETDINGTLFRNTSNTGMAFLTNNNIRMVISSDGNIAINESLTTDILRVGGNTFTNTITTLAPTGNSNPTWRLGAAATGTVNANRLIRVEIAGVGYDLVARQII